jgi:hypothetical protein
LDALEELKHFVRKLPPETAVELLGGLPSVFGLGGAQSKRFKDA